ncbi:hypothetical protein C1I98_15075 [Spongiactinospora gelatinilytica]|uniref:Aminoglycoside phosphotransferase domain-containing protein n=1 Tax=Spongiactinospora gelatinilytica TaxID=2666298 RepID=A0A2W2GCX0_9ACTN|nr:hypothetical protein [Spongiactinospora gelatinilytica]PZG45873.1 hypothetical protein C1I98_15075 [Spongiactinospora gelatinilytica]
MAVGQSTTHDLEFGDEVVIKRYRSWDRREPQREWTALTLLAEHAPGLAPAPIRADLNASPPTVVMSRLPGHVLRGAPATVAQTDAVAAAFTRLHQAIPGPVLGAVEPAAWGPAAAVAKVRTWADKRPDLGQDADVRHGDMCCSTQLDFVRRLLPWSRHSTLPNNCRSTPRMSSGRSLTCSVVPTPGMPVG